MDPNLALHTVNFMDLEEGHVLTDDEAKAIKDVLLMGYSLIEIKRALNIEYITEEV